ncbi:ABC transporter substrate-binding protein [Pseudooceanicola marinus]|uniref:ABC transporter substrate-binding protein n=1 Tax=Pseudooceanicola marinus TaxID=396013 RepID=UPI001C97A723|nr:ABC transporter substrate-binding protein [Pseudooceanicola marinus]MBY5973757.1 ABC transporter substrate-binding protein [Ferrimonas balearica]MCA1337519.1 ABC transporter substrate-binding protein [Pseudooceanicola marinus]
MYLGSKAIPMISALALGASALGAQAQTDIKFALDWRFEGPAAGFLLAEDLGYFEEEGLSVTIDTGTGSVNTIPRVASGLYDMGFGDLNSLVKFLDEDPEQPVIGVGMVYDKPTFGIVGRKSLGITEDPKSVEGHVLGAPPPDGAWAQWPIFKDVAEIDDSDITIESIGFPVREPMLANGDVDGVFGFTFSVILNLKAQGTPEDDIVEILMADHGLNLYGNAILANEDFAAENPEAVTGLLRAVIKGFAAAIEDPAAGAAAVAKRDGTLDVEVEQERLQMAIDGNILTPYVQENGMGGVDEERLASSIEQLKVSMGISDAIAPEDVFDSSYLPPAEERMLQ